MNIVSLALFAPRQGKQIFSIAGKSVVPYQPSGICDLLQNFVKKMNVKPDLIETAISINEQMDNLNPSKLFVKNRYQKITI
jgi:hypothetical protein